MNRLFVRLGIGLVFALFALFNYWGNVTDNPVTGEKQRIQISPRQEVVLGIQSREQMLAQHGGFFPDRTLQAYLDEVGNRIVQKSSASDSPYPFEFHLLRDTNTINAFALPGGQVFLTAALLRRLNSESQLAGVLGHEIGHVVARHGAEHLAKQQLGIALVDAVGIAASDTPESGRQAAILAQAVNQMLNLKYGRDDELESDRLGLRFMVEAGYNPIGLVELMEILGSTRSGSEPPEFFSSHPNPSNRIAKLRQIIAKYFPNNRIPDDLIEGQERFSQVVSPRI